jgi:hypothetical protein
MEPVQPIISSPVLTPASKTPTELFKMQEYSRRAKYLAIKGTHAKLFANLILANFDYFVVYQL